MTGDVQADEARCIYHSSRPGELRCEECGEAICVDCALELLGQTLCSRCRWAALYPFPHARLTLRRQDADDGTHLPDPLAATAGEDDAPPPRNGAAFCVRHPARAAEAPCDRCGDLICGLCRVEVDGRGYCTRCFGLLWKAGRLRPPGSALAIAALGAGALSICLLAPGCVPARYVAWLPIVLGASALWRMRAARGADRLSALAGMALGALAWVLPAAWHWAATR
jgi:hypothetical protein